MCSDKIDSKTQNKAGCIMKAVVFFWKQAITVITETNRNANWFTATRTTTFPK